MLPNPPMNYSIDKDNALKIALRIKITIIKEADPIRDIRHGLRYSTVNRRAFKNHRNPTDRGRKKVVRVKITIVNADVLQTNRQHMPSGGSISGKNNADVSRLPDTGS